MLKGVRAAAARRGLTIKGVQRLHQEQGLKRLAAYGDADGAVAFEPDGRRGRWSRPGGATPAVVDARCVRCWPSWRPRGPVWTRLCREAPERAADFGLRRRGPVYRERLSERGAAW